MNPERADEELLRELACNGDLHRIQALISSKPQLNINAQNAMNGWTALHWAAKRNHVQVAEFLLANGANREIQATDTSTPARLCTSDALRQLLETAASAGQRSSSPKPILPIIPNYLRNPVFPYIIPSQPSMPIHVNEDLITLLCRIADDPLEGDFIEFDFNKLPANGAYQRLVAILRDEFQLDHVEKIRRLPHIRLRHDRDVERLKDNHMLEVIRIKTDENMSSWDT